MLALPAMHRLLQLHLEPRRKLSINSLDLRNGKQQKVRQKIPGVSIGPAHITKILPLSNGLALIGMNCGMATLDGPTLDIRPIRAPIEKMNEAMRTDELWVSDILEDKNGDWWISTWNAGIIQYQKNAQQFVNQTFDLGGSGRQLYNKCYLSVVQDSLGRFVFGSNGTGLEIWNPADQSCRHVTGESTSAGGLQARFIYCQFIDQKKRHWIGTENGLYRYLAGAQADQAFVRYDIGGWIFSILSDSIGRLWLKTTLGLALFDPESGRKQVFGEAQGMTLQAPLAHKVLFLENEHRLWFGKSLHFDPLSVHFAGLNARPAITGLKIHDQAWQNGAPLNNVNHIDLAYNEQTLRFEFTALDFSVPPGQQQYMVKLEAINTGFPASKRPTWINLGNQPYATFANLAPGKYRLYYRCGNAEAGWLPESNAVTFDFTIHPHWSRTVWFRLLLGLVALGFTMSLLAAYYRYRLRAQQLENEKKQREAERRRLELEKTAITAEARRKTAESEMRLLRSQLNPHFLFNAINSINRYILTNDSEKAGEYLGKFAMLMRSILENSQTLTIALADELKMLDTYIALENLRFRQKITWNFVVNPDIDPEYVQVPSLFLQPFAENAILHGLAPKGGGHIELSIHMQDGALYCILRDNGVGRPPSGHPASMQPKPKHSSAGMRLISERLDTFAALEGQSANIQVIDLKQADGTPQGTEVRIVLPFVESV